MNNVTFDYSKLRGKIREVFKSEKNFAEAIGISKATLSAKLNNSAEFSQTEMDKACPLLGINQAEISVYFFTPKVQ